MRKVLAVFLVVLVAGCWAAAGYAADYDRYERGYPGSYPPPPPPPPTSPPPPMRVAPPPFRPVGFHAGPYLVANIGAFEPNDYSDGLAGYSADWSGNFMIGSRLAPFAAVEGGVGYFSANTGPNDVSVVPVTIGGRLIIPNPVFEPYFGGGIGVYFASLKEPVQVAPLIGTDDSTATLGGYVSIGADVWLNPSFALNVEGKYQMANPSFTSNTGVSYDVDVSGWEFVVGVRLNF
jgi:hypothetical protein